jgi:hypothetical protein
MGGVRWILEPSTSQIQDRRFTTSLTCSVLPVPPFPIGLSVPFFQNSTYYSSLKIEAVGPSETLIIGQQTARRHFQEENRTFILCIEGVDPMIPGSVR